MYSQHPLSALFPSMPVGDFEALVGDIRTNGLRHQIVLHDGKILDGWHRYRACVAAKVNPQFTKYSGKDPKALVLSENHHRRHLESPAQRAMIAVAVNEWRPVGAPGHTTAKSNVSVDTLPLKSGAELAAEAHVSAATINRAKVVEANGTEALKVAVKEGEVGLIKAVAIAKLPKAKQAKAIKEKAPKPKLTAKPGLDTVPRAEYDDLAAKYNDLSENRDDIAAELEAVEALRSDEHVVKIKQLQAELRACRRSRDTLMAQVADMTKQLQSFKRKLDKATAK